LRGGVKERTAEAQRAQRKRERISLETCFTWQSSCGGVLVVCHKDFDRLREFVVSNARA
jgi:hypothetical protein